MHNPPEVARAFIGVTQAADMLDVDRATITRWAKTGRLSPVGRLGDSRLATLVFDMSDVQHLRDQRDGIVGDVLDRVDIAAAGEDPAEDRSAYTRAAWLDGIEAVAARGSGEFSSGRVRSHVPEDATGPAVGGLITSLVRRRRIEWTGKWDTLNDARNRHGGAPCKVYLVVGDLA